MTDVKVVPVCLDVFALKVLDAECKKGCRKGKSKSRSHVIRRLLYSLYYARAGARKSPRLRVGRKPKEKKH